MNFRNCTTMDIDAFRKLKCSECDKDLDVKSYFLPVRIQSQYNEYRGMEIHVRCINSDCKKSNHNENPDYFKPIFVGAI